MLEKLIVAFACGSIVALVLAMVVLAVRWKRSLPRDTRWLLFAVLIFSVLHAISNLYEWIATDHSSMPMEDYFLLLLPASWGSFFYSFLQARSRAEVRRSEERYRSLTDDVLDSTAAGMCILDSVGHVVWTNQAFEEYFQLDRNEIVGRDCTRLIEDRLKYMVDDPDGWASEMLTGWDRGEVVETECHILPGAVRRERWLECRGQMIQSGLYKSGRIKHFYDITERKQAAEQREELLQVLERQKAELERFVYTVSHDLKTPLITIQGFLGVVKESLASGEVSEACSDLERIGRAADRMQKLLDELLELARVGRDNIDEEPVDLADVIAEALEVLHADIVNRGVTVVIHEGAAVVWGYRTRLVEVFQNLISNSIKYQGDQANPKIEISAESREKEIVCFVRDNGIGVKAEYKEKVFELFEQLDPRYEGTGIGLAIVKRIVESHGGRIWVESDKDRPGATFWFTLSNHRPLAAPGGPKGHLSVVDAKLPD